MSKASKQRACPALGRGISSADCGEQRQSRLACPADCTHNPFGPASYSQLLEIEDRLDAKIMERMTALAPDRAARQKDIARVERQGLHAIHAYFTWNLFFATGTDNHTFARRWELAGWSELRNDERVLLRGKMQMRVVLMEVHRVLADGRVEGVDLLSPNPELMVLQDRSLASRASRFSLFLTWVFPLPHYWRLCGTAALIPDIAHLPAPEIVREIVRHLGGPTTEPEIRRWLAEHFDRFDITLQAVLHERRQQMLAGLDAKWGKAVYELRAPFAQCRNRLDELAGVELEDLSPGEKNEGLAEARVWFDPEPGPRGMPGGQTVLGRVLLGQSLWRLETMGGEKLSRLRRQFEQQMGGSVRFTSERVEDLGARLAGQQSAADQSLIPPRLLENPDQFLLSSSRVPAPPPGVSRQDAEQEIMRAAHHAFLDGSIPLLENRTPREAALDPALRPKLIQLMKERVRSQDERNLQTGRADDLNWLLRELGLTEIIFDPPPWRPPPPSIENTREDDWQEPANFAEPVAADPHRPPAPPLPDEPLSPEEAAERLENALAFFETAGTAEAELGVSGATWLEDAEELTLDTLSEKDFCFAIPFLLQAWFALVPMGCRAPQIDFSSLEKTFESNLRGMDIAAQSTNPKKLMTFLQDGPQPGLAVLLISSFLEAANNAPKELRPSLEGQPIMLALLKSIIEELDTALRP